MSSSGSRVRSKPALFKLATVVVAASVLFVLLWRSSVGVSVPESPALLNVKADGLRSSDRICVLLDASYLFRGLEQDGFPVIVGADIPDDHKLKVIAEVSPSSASGLTRSLDPKAWEPSLTEEIRGPSSFCSQLDAQDRGSSVRRWAVDSVFIDGQMDPSVTHPMERQGDEIFATLLKRDPAAYVSHSDGQVSIQTPTVALETPTLEQRRLSIGTIYMVGDTAGFSATESSPLSQRIDIWTSIDPLSVTWTGTTIQGANARQAMREWMFLLLGVLIPLGLGLTAKLISTSPRLNSAAPHKAYPTIVELEEAEGGYRFVLVHRDDRLLTSKSYHTQRGARDAIDMSANRLKSAVVLDNPTRADSGE